MHAILKATAFIFDDQRYQSIYCDFKNIRSISLLGKMMIYKTVSYIANNNIAEQGSITLPKDLADSLDRNGFKTLIEAYISGGEHTAAYKKIKQTSEKKSFLLPEKLLRESFDSKQMTRLLKAIEKIYADFNNEKAFSVISSCICELLSNFWAHATQESETLFAAEGNDQFFNAVIADNAIGIVSNLKMAYPEFEKLSSGEVLLKAIEREVSSKRKLLADTGHMGYGLYIVAELVKLNDGNLEIWSEGGRITYKSGKFYSESCGYWKGTIIEVKLNLHKPKSIGYIDALVNDPQLKDVPLKLV